MKNVKLTISYDGSNFYGYQIQPDKRTVQEEIEKAINKLTKENIKLISAGRTDSGVHALGQVANFITRSNIPAESFMFKLRKYLPDDILIIKSEEVDLEFNSRFNAKIKKYRYIISKDDVDYPFYRNYKLYIKHELNIEKMIEASKLLLGVHDFTAFMKLGQDKNPIRSLDKIEIYKFNKDIYLEFEAQSFLHNQIRIMVGLLIDIGRGFREVDYVEEIFKNGVKRAAKTYGPQGLYLMEIRY